MRIQTQKRREKMKYFMFIRARLCYIYIYIRTYNRWCEDWWRRFFQMTCIWRVARGPNRVSTETMFLYHSIFLYPSRPYIHALSISAVYYINILWRVRIHRDSYSRPSSHTLVDHSIIIMQMHVTSKWGGVPEILYFSRQWSVRDSEYVLAETTTPIIFR